MARTTVVASLAAARLRYRPLRRVLVVLGVAAAVAVPVAAQVSARVVSAQALAYGVQSLPPGQRSLIVSVSGVQRSAEQLAGLDAHARAALDQLAVGPVRRELLYRQAADQRGGTFFLGATDDLASAVRVTQGRLPTSCTPQRCEVVVVGAGSPTLDPALGLVVVGRAERTDPLLLTGTFDPGHDAPLLLADGVDKAQSLASLQLFQRAYGWVAPLDLDLVRRLGVDAYLARSAAASDQLGSVPGGLQLTAPDQTLRAEDDRARLSANRFALLAGSATALLLGFCVIAAAGLRRDRLALDALLRRRGASPGTVRLLGVVEAVVPVALGAVLGLLLGGAVGAVTAARADLPAASTAWTGVVAALPGVLVSAALAALVVAVTSSWWGGSSHSGGDRTAWRVVDATIVVGLAVVALAVARGTIGTASLGGGTDPLLTVLPVLVVLCGGLLAARLWPVTVTTLGRVLPHAWVGARVGLLGAARRPLRPVATVAFLTAATAVVVFAGSYRSTLAQGAVDQATFQVPTTARVTTGTTLERPLDVASPAAYEATVPGVVVHPVVRSSASVRISSAEAVPVELLGVDPQALASVRSWPHVVGALDPTTAASRLTSGGPTAPVGDALPAGAQRMDVRATGAVDQLQVTAWWRLADGRDIPVELAPTATGFGAVLPPTLTSAEGTARLFSLALEEAPDFATREQHHIGEGLTGLDVLGGRVVFAAPSYGSAGNGSWTGWGATSRSGSVSAQPDPAGLAVTYAFTGERLVLRPGATATDADLPVLVDPATAARAVDGRIQLAVTSGLPIPARVVGVLPRFPTVGDAFAVADQAALGERLDSREPGTGAVGELWLSAPPDQSAALATALGAAPYDRLTVTDQAAEQARLAGDPLAGGAASLLVVTALLAVAVAVLAVVLLVVADRRDEAAELYAWESDGVAPRTLRASLFARAVAVVGLALPAGVALGLLLAGATAAIVTVTAVGTAPHPPLALSVGPVWVAVVLGTGLLVSLVAAALVAAGSLREDLPRAPDVVLR
jgi:hypothetical protein